MGKIQLEGIEFYAYHGHYEEEQRSGNQFIVDLTIETDCTVPAESDNLKDALNYQMIYKVIQHQMQIKSHLLENICHRIIKAILADFKNIDRITVKISKLNPPLGGKVGCISVTITEEAEK